MNKPIIVCLLLVGTVLAHPQRGGHRGSGGYSHDSNHQPASYSFGYNVNDNYQGAQFGHDEKRNGDSTSGSYFVHLPDGRMQTVTYSVDGYKGYVAEVKYSGKAQFDSPPRKSSGGFKGYN
eukprot:TCALIF_11898-PA protein Name:"Similar to resilin Pro-resilin (Drosophila melanogaster)" AED:0.33 eAED:0.33 QI:35/1/0.5/1/0/0.5/2/0/120